LTARVEEIQGSSSSNSISAESVVVNERCGLSIRHATVFRFSKVSNALRTPFKKVFYIYGADPTIEELKNYFSSKYKLFTSGMPEEICDSFESWWDFTYTHLLVPSMRNTWHWFANRLKSQLTDTYRFLPKINLKTATKLELQNFKAAVSAQPNLLNDLLNPLNYNLRPMLIKGFQLASDIREIPRHCVAFATLVFNRLIICQQGLDFGDDIWPGCYQECLKSAFTIHQQSLLNQGRRDESLYNNSKNSRGLSTESRPSFDSTTGCLVVRQKPSTPADALVTW